MSSKPRKSSKFKKGSTPSSAASSNDDLPEPAGYLISTDVPTAQFIKHHNELKPVDKKFILQDLDSTHMLIREDAKPEVTRKIEAWLDENVWSSVERVGEDLDMS
jgi:TFIIH basal transcription factor complex TTD-A subunit